MSRHIKQRKISTPELIAQINPKNKQLISEWINYLKSVQRSDGTIKSYNEDLEILEAIHKPDYFYDLVNRNKMALDDIKGEVVSFCGLGDPASFEQILKNLGLKIKQTWRFKDHNAYTLEEIKSLAGFRKGLPLITTFKDYVKFPKGWQEVIKNKIYILAINLEIKEGNETFLKVLKGK